MITVNDDKIDLVIIREIPFFDKITVAGLNHVLLEVAENNADIIAEFDLLKVIIYVQAKLHDDTTSMWAVEQIAKYKSQFDYQFSEYTSIPWVITTAEYFSNEALVIAQHNNVRLISGIEFARMLIDAGITNIDRAFE
jgi:hypothetical protein